MNKINDKFKVIENITEDYLQKQKLIQDTKYQDITYYKQNGNDIIEAKDCVLIDFIKAMNEMENLNWNLFNHIGFVNNKRNENLQFIREGFDNWYADVPIKNGKKWEGYYWAAYGDSKNVSVMMRLFFEEVEWFGMLKWKMRRRFGFD